MVHRRRSARPSSDPDPLQTAPLDSDARAALEALVHALAAVDLTVVLTASALGTPLDLVAALFQHAAPLAGRATELARLLVHHSVASPEAPGRARLRAAVEELQEETARFHAEREAREGYSTEGLTGELRDATLEEMDDLLREVGLEELDADLHLAYQNDGTPVLAWMPIPPETAHVWLLSRLYPRVELTVHADPLLSIERRASRWWFERWSSAAHRGEEWQFTWTVREQEYSLVERSTLALEAPILDAFCKQEFFATVPERQQRMAEALTESFLSIFRVHEHDASRLVLEDVADGRRYEVHEHNPELEYRQGFLGLGRLLPFEGNRYLRSPGMALLQDTGGGLTSKLVQGLGLAEEGIGRGVAMESFLALMAKRREKLPRRVVPAESPREAQELLKELQEALQENGLVEAVTAGEAPSELREAAAELTAEAAFMRFPVDEPLAEWIRALTEQAGVPARRRERKQKKDRKRKRR
jgi:hypothetical protein